MPGWLTIVLVTSFIGGIQLVVIGVVGEYVARIYDEVKARPLYLVRELHGFEHEQLPRQTTLRRQSPEPVSTWAQRLSPLPRTLRLPLVAELGGLAFVVVAAAYVYTRNLHSYLGYDEGNYLGSLDALRHGQTLGHDVFLDQPPGWYLLLVAVSYPFGNSVGGVRTGSWSSRSWQSWRHMRAAGWPAGRSPASPPPR